MGDFAAVFNSKLNMLRNKYRFRRWDILALDRVYSWAGHVSRFAHWAPERLAYRTLVFRDSRYLRVLENLYGGQLHGRKFKVWRYEQQFSKILGPDWHSLSKNQEVWDSYRSVWLSERLSDMKQ